MRKSRKGSFKLAMLTLCVGALFSIISASSTEDKTYHVAGIYLTNEFGDPVGVMCPASGFALCIIHIGGPMLPGDK